MRVNKMNRYKIRIIFAILKLLLLAFNAYSADGELPVNSQSYSVNIVTGVPLTIPENRLKELGISKSENTGGWGDVMANVTMAFELKKSYPNLNVRLIVTLNDYDKSEYTNKVSKSILKLLNTSQENNDLNLNTKNKQTYNNVEIYFVDLPFFPDNSTIKKNKAKLNQATQHIPSADFGVQFSSNNSLMPNLILKASKMLYYFQEYDPQKDSFEYFLSKEKPPISKLFAGPLGLGIYGFDSIYDKHNSQFNKKLINHYLKETAQFNFKNDLSIYEIAYAYAGDKEMIDDYIEAIKRISQLSENKDKKYLIFYKKSGGSTNDGIQFSTQKNITLFPLGSHPKELSHALISESTISPLITGDGSLSSALETTSKNKSLLYEGNPWKIPMVYSFLNWVFKNNNDIKFTDLIIPLTKDLESQNMKSEQRIEQIYNALLDSNIHGILNQFIKTHKSQLKLGDNLVNLFQLYPIFESLTKSFDNSPTAKSEYLEWLVSTVKHYKSNDPNKIRNYFYSQFNDKIQNHPFQLLEKWYSFLTLIELKIPLKPEVLSQLINETNDTLSSKFRSETNLELLEKLSSFIKGLKSSSTFKNYWNSNLEFLNESQNSEIQNFKKLFKIKNSNIKNNKNPICKNLFASLPI